MNARETDILLIGIGNSGRRDDGLGWAFLDEMADILPQNWRCEYRYQLQVEDAELISGFKEVYFVDADQRAHPDGFCLEPIVPAGDASFTTHELKAEAVLYLCREIYGVLPRAEMLGITGTRFELENGLSTEAQMNLHSALQFFKNEILIDNFVKT